VKELNVQFIENRSTDSSDSAFTDYRLSNSVDSSWDVVGLHFMDLDYFAVV
jgi:hypothetical protein